MDISEEDLLQNKNDAANQNRNDENHLMTLGLLKIFKEATLS
jgi:hypothetical protein